MSRTRHDQFAKELLAGLLETVGLAKTEVNVTSEVRKIDLLFVPLPEKAADRQPLGLLGRIAATACLIEPYRNPPAHDEINACQLRLLIQRGERQREAKRNGQSLREDDYEMLWVVGPTISQAVVAAFGAQPSQEWGTGVYLCSSGWRTVLVAVHQLTPGRDTLWLRVLGRGKIQQQAIEEVLALPKETPLRNLALQLINAWKIRTEQLGELSVEEEEQLMNFSPAYLEWEEQTLQKGRQEGRQEGRELGQQEGELRGRELGRQEAAREVLVRLLTRKFGPLSAQVVSEIQSIADTEKLEQLAEALIDAPDLQSFRQHL